jgi:[acyl-carrier-protein] S-malonyltransferase
MSAAILFPGQGSQHPGMGRDWAEAWPLARETFEAADRLLGLPLSTLCWEGGEEVHRTDIAQPGIFTTGVAIVRVLRERGILSEPPPMTAGLSLGEYTALWCAGALGFEDGLRLVRLRGEAMQAASDAIQSGMTSLIGADEEQARALAEIGSVRGICSIANRNAPGQIVLAGEITALEEVEARSKELGVRRAVRLTVAGGFHSECMRPAALRLEAALAEVEIRPPSLPFVSNVTAEPTDDPERIREQLALQVCSPVLWEASMRWALSQGIRDFLEPGPGTVLAGLLRKIDPSAQVRSAASPADFPA